MQRGVVETFWRRRQEVVEATVNFSEREIPLARLKKMICSLKGSMMMTFDTPGFMSKACELFVQELAIRSWMCAESHHRCVILDSDIAEAIAATECYDFLVDTLHDHWAKHSSAPRPKSTGKRRRPGPGRVSTSPRRSQAPHFDVPCTNYVARGSNFFGNTVSNSVPSNIIASHNSTSTGFMAPLPVLSDIPNTCFCMNMGNASEHQVPAFHHLVPLHFSYPLPVASNNDPAIVSTIELSLILPEGSETSSTIHDSGTANGNGYIHVDVVNDVDAGQLQQQEKETIVDHHRSVLNGSVDVETVAAAAATTGGGNENRIDEDEGEIADESLLDRFLEEIQTDEELLSLGTTSDDTLPLVDTILDVEEYSIGEPYVLDGISPAQAPTTE